MTHRPRNSPPRSRPVPLVAILRGLRPEEAQPVGAALVDSGWRLIEVPLNSPEPLAKHRDAGRAPFPQALVGAGTVLQPEQVREVHAAGGRLVVAPNFNAARWCARRCGWAWSACPGVLTATEAFAALAAGATGLKLFPAEMIPPAAVKALRAVLPADTLLLPVGGITTANMAGLPRGGRRRLRHRLGAVPAGTGQRGGRPAGARLHGRLRGYHAGMTSDVVVVDGSRMVLNCTVPA